MTTPFDPLDFDAPLFAQPEKLLLGLLKPLEAVVPGLKVRTFIEDDLTTPYVLVRSDTGSWNSDSFGGNDTRFSRRLLVDLQTWTEDGLEDGDASGDSRGAWLQELCRLRLFTAWRRSEVVPGAGHIAMFRVSSPAHRTADWATSTGVNQYANLPKGLSRYEAKYGVTMRPDFTSPLTGADLVAAITS